MQWEEPAVYEIKMDAEIGAYQDDFGSVPVIDRRGEGLDLDARVLDSEAA